MSAVHAVSIDHSPTSGSVVVCTCGLSLGPFAARAQARQAAADHRRWTERDRDRARHARAKAARKPAAEGAAEA